MQLPVDVKALLDEVTNIKAAKEMPLSVSVYIDPAAPGEFAAHVRGAFSSPNANVRLAVTYLDAGFAPHPTDDFAVVVAGAGKASGAGPVVGDVAAALREVGVPAMVATLSAEDVVRSGVAIPDGDVVSPAADAASFDDAAASALDERMGRWVVSACREKRLAFAIAFPFMRRPLAKDAVQLTAIENAGVGLIPLIPGADLPIMTLNQAKMALQIAAAYGHEMDKGRLKELAIVIGGAYVSRGIVRRLVAAVPFLGFVFKTGVAYGTTMAVGYAIIEYFEGGEDATGIANVIERAAEKGTQLAAKLPASLPA